MLLSTGASYIPMDYLFTHRNILDVPIILSSILSRALSFQGPTPGLFGYVFWSLQLFTTDPPLQSSALAGDWMQGLLLSVMVVGVFLAVSALRDYLVRVDMNHPDVLLEQQHQQLPQQQVPQDTSHLNSINKWYSAQLYIQPALSLPSLSTYCSDSH
jgi:hypothetical protein